MNWDSIIGSVAQVMIKALPVILYGPPKTAKDEPTMIGPCTLAWDELGGWKLQNDTETPVNLVFTTPDETTPSTEKTLTFNLTTTQYTYLHDFIHEYLHGTCSIGRSPATSEQFPGGAMFGMFSKAIITRGQPLIVNVNTNLSIELTLGVNRNMVYITAIGGALGTSYIFSGANRAGDTGSTSGTIQNAPPPEGVGDSNRYYEIPLPANVDFSTGVTNFSLQLELDEPLESFSSDPAVVIHQ